MKETIPDIIADKTTLLKKHTWYTHLLCVLFRIIIGIALISYDPISSKINDILIVLSLIVVIFFAYKFQTNSRTWKVYLRTMVSYSTIAYLLSIQKNKEAGIIAIVDALLGLQSRHTATLFNIMK